MWMGLLVLFLALGISQGVFAAEPYAVRQGDTLARISKKFGVSIEVLKAANDLHSDALKIRQILLIPQPRKTKIAHSKKSAPAIQTSYVVKKGDNLHAIARKTGVSVNDIKRINDLRDNRLRPGQQLAVAKTGAPGDAVPSAEASVEPAILNELPDGEEPDEDEAGSASAEDQPQTDVEEDESAVLLGKWESPREQQLLARVAMGFMGTPYRLGGSSMRGLDCSAFVKKIYAFFGIELPRTAREQARIGKHIPRNELEVGDLVFFNTRRAFGHVGVYVGNNQFVHASSGRTRAVRVDTLDKPYYNKRFVKAVRLKALDDDT
jgi:cell wall-associated NlpC family hydrolase